jgi:hypothetical protein
LRLHTANSFFYILSAVIRWHYYRNQIVHIILQCYSIFIIDNSYNTAYIDNLSSFTIKADRKYDNDYESSGDTKAPIIREEYRVGVSAPENIKGNIYIDRGINSAFEKHLKLGEVASLEALENYGNNYFKIMDV